MTETNFPDYQGAWERGCSAVGALAGVGLSVWYTAGMPPQDYTDYAINVAVVGLSAFYGSKMGRAFGIVLDEAFRKPRREE